jgi:LmbE family N-acetylglucosaminyl deacetylase
MVDAAVSLHIVAHPDDDLLFLSPDIDRHINSGGRSITVVITAGDITGNGTTPGERTRNRQRGLMDAYARMAGIPDSNPNAQEEWSGDAWLISGRRVERYWLNAAAARVDLVFMNLRDASLEGVRGGATDNTVIPTGGMVTQSFSYNATQVVSTLAAIINHYAPTVVRAQDTNPDHRYTEDHDDHVSAARFAAEAVDASDHEPIEINYRDYNIFDCQVNLPVDVRTRKNNIFNTYRRYDTGAYDPGWVDRMYFRETRGTEWVGRDTNGRPNVFVVRNGVPSTRKQNTNGSWTAEATIGGTGGTVAPGIVAANLPNGRIQLFARRTTDHRLITLAQNASNAFIGTWTDLGNPNQGSTMAAEVGIPAVALNANGRLQLFVKNGGGGLSSRVQTSATAWGGWQDLGGSDLQDGVSAIANLDGRVEVFASSRDKIAHWYQSAVNGTFTRNNAFPSAAPGSPPTASMNQDGRLEIAYRQAGTSDLMVNWQTSLGGGWSTASSLGGHAGIGQPTTVTAPTGTDGRIMMFIRNGGGGASMIRQGAPNEAYGGWEDLFGLVHDYPSAFVTTNGTAMVFVIAADGRVHYRVQSSPGGSNAFGGWELIN